jgi:hypothetical protein
LVVLKNENKNMDESTLNPTAPTPEITATPIIPENAAPSQEDLA